MEQRRTNIRIIRNGLLLAGILTGLALGTFLDGRTTSLSAGFIRQEDPFATGTPTVRLISPNGGERWEGTHSIIWTAVDPQNDSLIYTIYYSSNEGRTWIQLATGLTDPSYAWDTTTVTNGAMYQIQVDAYDGQYIGSDVSDAPFEIANKQSLFGRFLIGIISSSAVPLVLGAFSLLFVLGALFKAASIPPLQGKGAWKDFFKRLLWFLCYPIIWVFNHVIYGPTLRRLKREDVTKNATRQAILQLLEDRGLVYLREMERAVGVGIFGLKWHLQVLDDFGYVRHRKIGRHLVYYLKELDTQDDSMVELGFLFKSKTTRVILDYIRIHPHTYQTEIANDIGLPTTTMRRHLQQLQEHKLIEVVLEGRRTHYLISTEKNNLINALFQKIKPED